MLSIRFVALLVIEFCLFVAGRRFMFFPDLCGFDGVMVFIGVLPVDLLVCIIWFFYLCVIFVPICLLVLLFCV